MLTSPRQLALFANLAGYRCLLVGGGQVAARKLRTLTATGASIEVVSPVLGTEMRAALEQGLFEYRQRAFDPGDIDGVRLVIAATGRTHINAAVAAAARARNVFVNVVDDPALCDVTMPAVVDRAPLQVAISTAGNAPVLARRIRGMLERALPARLGEFVEWIGSWRDHVARTLPPEARREFWERVFGAGVDNAFLEHGAASATARIEQLLHGQAARVGEVALVGAGPGDPELLTLKALKKLEHADVIVHDRLVPAAVLALARRDAERIDVGKTAGRHTLPQAEINALLVSLARSGKRVCRLKGGDPFVFGRGGEEMEVLAAAGVTVEVVPGITAMTGCAASLGLPLTHRAVGGRLNVVTGHQCRGEDLDCDWPGLARPGQTTVFYMGLKNLARICTNLVEAGADPHLPAAVIENGTCASERVVCGTLADLPSRVAAAQIGSAALIVVGEVVARRLQALRSGTPAPHAAPAYRTREPGDVLAATP